MKVYQVECRATVTLAAHRTNAPRLVYRLVRGRRIFLRDICAAIFYSRERE